MTSDQFINADFTRLINAKLKYAVITRKYSPNK